MDFQISQFSSNSLEPSICESRESEFQAPKCPLPSNYPPSSYENHATVAIRNTRRPHKFKLVIELLSIIFTASILTLCGMNVYFKDAEAPNVNAQLQAFQFVAKVHEIIITSSLVVITLHHLHYELCQGNGVPLGYLTAPFQLSAPLALFMKEFTSNLPIQFSMPSRVVPTAQDTKSQGFGYVSGSQNPLVNSSRGTSYRRFWLGMLILTATFVTALIGPSSAILLVPQLNWWNVDQPFSSRLYDGFTYWNATYDDLWPTKINSSIIPDVCKPDSLTYECPYYNANGLYLWAKDYHSQWAPSNLTVSDQGNMVRYLTSSNNSNGHLGYSVSSTPTSGLSRNLGTMWLYTQRSKRHVASVGRPMITMYSYEEEKPIMRPLVQCQCAPAVDISKAERLNITFRSSQLKYAPGEQASPRNMTIETDVRPYRLNFSLATNVTDLPPKVEFLDLSSTAGRPAIGALISVTFQNAAKIFHDNEENIARAIYPCMLTYHWVPSTASRDPRNNNVVIVDKPDPADFTKKGPLPKKSRPIHVDLSYMQQLNALINGEGSQRIFEMEVSAFETYSKYYYDGRWNHRWPWLFSTMLSLQSTDALARINHYLPTIIWNIVPNDPKRHNHLLNLADLNNKQYAADQHDSGVIGNQEEILNHPELYTAIKWKVAKLGYGWRLDSLNQSIPKALALTIILLHAVMLLPHLFLGWIWRRHWRCDSWRTPLDLVLLALQTPRSVNGKVIQGIGTGVQDRRTYRETVRISEGEVRENGDTSVVMLVSGRDEDEKNSAYKQNTIAEKGPRRYRHLGRKLHHHGTHDSAENGLTGAAPFRYENRFENRLVPDRAYL